MGIILENKKELNIIFKDVLIGIQQQRKHYNKECFFEYNEVKLYVNESGDYFSVTLGKSKWLIYNHDNKQDEYKIEFDGTNSSLKEIDDRIGMLLLDSFEYVYEVMYNHNNEEVITHNKLIDKLFKKFVQRRKLKPANDTILNIKKTNKVYI